MNEITEQSNKKTIRKQFLIDINKHLINYDLINEKTNKEISFKDDNNYDWYIKKIIFIEDNYTEYAVKFYAKIGNKHLRIPITFVEFNEKNILKYQYKNYTIRFRKNIRI
jgi:hypothetical protein